MFAVLYLLKRELCQTIHSIQQESQIDSVTIWGCCATLQHFLSRFCFKFLVVRALSCGTKRWSNKATITKNKTKQNHTSAHNETSAHKHNIQTLNLWIVLFWIGRGWLGHHFLGVGDACSNLSSVPVSNNYQRNHISVAKMQRNQF